MGMGKNSVIRYDFRKKCMCNKSDKIEIKNKYQEERDNISDLYFNQKEYKKCETAIKNLIKKIASEADSDDCDGWETNENTHNNFIMLSLCNNEMNKLNETITYAKLALKYTPNKKENIRTLWSYGLFYEKIDSKLAIEYYEKAIKLCNFINNIEYNELVYIIRFNKARVENNVEDMINYKNIISENNILDENYKEYAIDNMNGFIAEKYATNKENEKSEIYLNKIINKESFQIWTDKITLCSKMLKVL